MGKIVVSEFVTLDGVVQDPTGEDGFEHGGWFNGMSDADRAEWAKVGLEEALSAEALLLGRRSDEYFAPRWLARSGEWADRLNSLPKYVVSSTAEDVKWRTSSNSSVLRGDVVDAVGKLQRELPGEIMVIASIQLAHTLMAHDLVDELRLLVYPVVLGAGERLFDETSGKSEMRLVDARPVGDNLAQLTYERVRGR
jgi:dihydrofolate reductase